MADEISKELTVLQADQDGNEQSGRSRKVKVFVLGGIILLAVIVFVAFFLWRNRSDEGAETVKVAVSMPFHLKAGEDILNGVTLAFEAVNYHADRVRVELVMLNDGNEAGAWQEVLEEQNALEMAADPDIVAYLGPLNSGAAKISMPVLNEAGIVQVSPGNTWPGLTKEGFFPAEPIIFYPTGRRHYARVVTTDDLQGPAGAVWAEELGFKTVYIVDDGEAYGKGIADLFRARAKALGMTVLKQRTIDKTSADFSVEVADIARLNPDLVYYGGNVPNGITILLRQMRDAGIEAQFMGPDAMIDRDFILRTGAENVEGALATTVGALARHIGTEKADAFYAAYVQRFKEEPGVFSLFGFEAAQVVLAGIERAGTKDRTGIREAVMNTKDYDGLLGTWSFDENGDTTLKLMSGNVIRDGKFEHVKTLRVP